MNAPRIEKLEVSAYTIPTDQPESDGTIKWDSSTIVIVEAEAGGKRSLVYGYADEATAKVIDSKLKNVVIGMDAIAERRLRRDGRSDPQSRPPWDLFDGDLRS